MIKRERSVLEEKFSIFSKEWRLVSESIPEYRAKCSIEKTTQAMFADHEIEFKSGIDAGNFQKFIAYLQVAVDELSNGFEYYLIFYLWLEAIVATSKGGLDTMHNCAVRVFNLLKIDLETRNSGTNKDWSQNFIESYMLYIHFDDDFSSIFYIIPLF